jgi:hypothetical protein
MCCKITFYWCVHNINNIPYPFLISQVMFVNKVSLHGIFSGKNKHECVKANEGAAAELLAALNFDLKQFL